MLPNQQCQSSESMVLFLSTNIISENAGIVSQFASFSHNQQFEREMKKKCEEKVKWTPYIEVCSDSAEVQRLSVTM